MIGSFTPGREKKLIGRVGDDLLSRRLRATCHLFNPLKTLQFTRSESCMLCLKLDSPYACQEGRQQMIISLWIRMDSSGNVRVCA
jgi:hypothetical protein